MLFCRLSPEQRELYRAYLASKDVEAILAGDRNALAGIDVLRKICNHPDLLQVLVVMDKLADLNLRQMLRLSLSAFAVWVLRKRLRVSKVLVNYCNVTFAAKRLVNSGLCCCSEPRGKTRTATALPNARASCKSSRRCACSAMPMCALAVASFSTPAHMPDVLHHALLGAAWHLSYTYSNCASCRRC